MFCKCFEFLCSMVIKMSLTLVSLREKGFKNFLFMSEAFKTFLTIQRTCVPLKKSIFLKALNKGFKIRCRQSLT